MTTRDELRAEKALQGLEFPASKAQLIDYATERSATPKTLEALHALPDREYANKDDVVEAVPQEPEGDAPGGVHR
ncbi:DUF2795 domain-containing protein [Brevibacterium marinum]|uniref:Phosphosulfolactate phosphohydrolase-like enzyme n=1 Tax=Brevibacterium marinum TaxID=418643 RepID=A0A846S6F5_9MICO|nr:DUF2795 domain-containing protein [Brevibacterium marinum]NJC56417.1 phosphosulfolactate phosphohydrolase-like enzyme [Brevibacterium marinum]